MTIEIKPEVKTVIDERLKNGAFHDVDELLIRALDALSDEAGADLLASTKGLEKNEDRPGDWRKLRGLARGTDSLTEALMQDRSAEKAHEGRIPGS